MKFGAAPGSADFGGRGVLPVSSLRPLTAAAPRIPGGPGARLNFRTNSVVRMEAGAALRSSERGLESAVLTRRGVVGSLTRPTGADRRPPPVDRPASLLATPQRLASAPRRWLSPRPAPSGLSWQRACRGAEGGGGTGCWGPAPHPGPGTLPFEERGCFWPADAS